MTAKFKQKLTLYIKLKSKLDLKLISAFTEQAQHLAPEVFQHKTHEIDLL